VDDDLNRDSAGEGMAAFGVLLNWREGVCLLFAMAAMDRRERDWRRRLRVADVIATSDASETAAMLPVWTW